MGQARRVWDVGLSFRGEGPQDNPCKTQRLLTRCLGEHEHCREGRGYEPADAGCIGVRQGHSHWVELWQQHGCVIAEPWPVCRAI